MLDVWLLSMFGKHSSCRQWDCEDVAHVWLGALGFSSLRRRLRLEDREDILSWLYCPPWQ